MSGIQFGQQLDLNSNKITELAPGTAPTDAINLSQLTAFADGFAQTIGDGILSTFTITHNLALANKDDYVIRVAEIATGAEYLVENNSVGINSLTVTFGFIPALNTYRVAVQPVR
jgi:hypothetical protein